MSEGARFIEQRGLDAFLRGSAALPPLPVLDEAGAWPMPAPDVAERRLPRVLRGAAATDLPGPDAIAALPHDVLLLPWADDPGHPVSTSERLLALLPQATMHISRTPDDLRERGHRIAEFLTR